MQHFLFIRAVNVGKRQMKSADLKAMLVDLGFDEVSVFLASGNAVFHTKRQAVSKLIQKIESAIEETFQYTAECFLYSRSELQKLIDADPFQLSSQQRTDFTVNIAFLRKTVSKPTWTTIESIKGDYDDFAQVQQTIFWLCRGKRVTDSPVGDTFVKTLPQPNTMRKINTIERMLAKFPG